MSLYFNPYRYSLGATQAPQRADNNSSPEIFRFGDNKNCDTFENNSPTKYFKEEYIKNMLIENPEIKQILRQNHIPVRLNMKELTELKNGHAKDTQDIADAIVKNLPPALKDKVDIQSIKTAALLHDVGKVLIPIEILNKEGALTNEERRVINLHPELGYQLLNNGEVNSQILNLVRYHHNIDKTLPDIDLQILNLADKYSALREKRPYKDKYSEKKALTILHRDVIKGEIHPALFNALVQSVALEQQEKFVKIS